MVELLTVISVLAVMLAALAPSFVDFLAAQQTRGLSYDLTADMMLARNEALKRNASVAISRGGSGWEQGWTVATVSTAETINHRNAAAQAITVTGAPSSITFDVNGRVSAPLQAVRITITGRSTSRCVELDLSGRARALSGACA